MPVVDSARVVIFVVEFAVAVAAGDGIVQITIFGRLLPHCEFSFAIFLPHDLNYMHSLPQLGEWRVKNFRKYLLEWQGEGGARGVRNFYFGGGSCILKENLKLHNPSIKSIFRITSL